MSSHFPHKEPSRLSIKAATKVACTHPHVANMSTDVHYKINEVCILKRTHPVLHAVCKTKSPDSLSLERVNVQLLSEYATHSIQLHHSVIIPHI